MYSMLIPSHSPILFEKLKIHFIRVFEKIESLDNNFIESVNSLESLRYRKSFDKINMEASSLFLDGPEKLFEAKEI